MRTLQVLQVQVNELEGGGSVIKPTSSVPFKCLKCIMLDCEDGMKITDMSYQVNTPLQSRNKITVQEITSFATC